MKAPIWALTALVTLLLISLASGCGGGSPALPDGDGGTDSDSDSDSDGDSDSDSDSDSDTDADAESCRHVDVVISVDGSGSMVQELQALREDVFPAFAAQLDDISEGLDDFRVATIDACPDPANYHTQGGGGECDFHGGNVWIESSSPTMNDEFACVGDIYLGDINCTGDNDDEQPASAAATSLEPPYATGANDGFSRDEALLVILAITDEDEQPTGGAQTAEEVYDRLVATKGDVKRIVFVGIGGSEACDGAYGSAEEAAVLREITDLFIDEDRGVWWDLCQGQLEDGLEAAFAIIEQACDELPDVE